ncbi:hypothetical protein K525DRAFT_268156 [Schizophyllum commune Loenen D]|nr:hypothetical protein K525DRAFT_268156 [Schizophyllum commune Loenen D]
MPATRSSVSLQSANLTNLKIVRARLRKPASFKHLLIDPFTLDPHHMELASPEVHGAIEELGHLDIAVKLQYAFNPDVRDEVDQAFYDAYEKCMRIIWPTFILWLDFLHPMRHRGTRSFEDVPLGVLIDVMYSIFVSKGSKVAALRAHTPRLYELLFKLWLRLDKYCTPEADYCGLIETLTCTIRSAIEVDEKRATLAAQTGSELALKKELNAFISANLTPHFAPAALYAAGGRLRDVYRLSLKQTGLLVRAVFIRPDDIAIRSALSGQIDTISQLAEGALVSTSHAQSTVTSLVGILRALRGLRGGEGHAIRVVHVLSSIWQDCDDGRSIAWAVEKDVVAILVAFYKKTSDPQHKQLIDAALRIVAQSTYQLRVARAFSTSDLNLSFRGAGFVHSDMLASVDLWITDRATLAQRTYRRGCFYPGQSAEKVRVRRCPCLSASYCSKECQRGDWQTHKAQCLRHSNIHYMRLMCADMLDEYSLPDAHFISVCAQEYLAANITSIVRSIQRLLENCPPMKHAPNISIMINVARLFCAYHVLADEQVSDSSDDEPDNAMSREEKLQLGVAAIKNDEIRSSYTCMRTTTGSGGGVYVYKDSRQIQTDPPILVVAIAGGKFLHVTASNLSILEALAKGKGGEVARA